MEFFKFNQNKKIDETRGTPTPPKQNTSWWTRGNLTTALALGMAASSSLSAQETQQTKNTTQNEQTKKPEVREVVKKFKNGIVEIYNNGNDLWYRNKDISENTLITETYLNGRNTLISKRIYNISGGDMKSMAYFLYDDKHKLSFIRSGDYTYHFNEQGKITSVTKEKIQLKKNSNVIYETVLENIKPEEAPTPPAEPEDLPPGDVEIKAEETGAKPAEKKQQNTEIGQKENKDKNSEYEVSTKIYEEKTTIKKFKNGITETYINGKLDKKNNTKEETVELYSDDGTILLVYTDGVLDKKNRMVYYTQIKFDEKGNLESIESLAKEDRGKEQGPYKRYTYKFKDGKLLKLIENISSENTIPINKEIGTTEGPEVPKIPERLKEGEGGFTEESEIKKSEIKKFKNGITEAYIDGKLDYRTNGTKDPKDDVIKETYKEGVIFSKEYTWGENYSYFEYKNGKVQIIKYWTKNNKTGLLNKYFYAFDSDGILLSVEKYNNDGKPGDKEWTEVPKESAPTPPTPPADLPPGGPGDVPSPKTESPQSKNEEGAKVTEIFGGGKEYKYPDGRIKTVLPNGMVVEIPAPNKPEVPKPTVETEKTEPAPINKTEPPKEQPKKRVGRRRPIAGGMQYSTYSEKNSPYRSYGDTSIRRNIDELPLPFEFREKNPYKLNDKQLRETFNITIRILQTYLENESVWNSIKRENAEEIIELMKKQSESDTGHLKPFFEFIKKIKEISKTNPEKGNKVKRPETLEEYLIRAIQKIVAEDTVSQLPKLN